MLDRMRTEAPAWFSVDEVAKAAGVQIEEVWRLIELGQAAVHEETRLMSAGDAVHLIRVLRGREPQSANRFPFNKIPAPARKTGRSLLTSGALHGAGVLLLIVSASIGLTDAATTKEARDDEHVKLVYLMMPGPGGGGGGGGLREPKPAPPAKKKALVTFKKAASPVPPARPTAAPPQPQPAPPQPEARVEAKPIDKPVQPAPPAVQAPVKPIPADPVEVNGVPTEAPPAPPSRGPGTGAGTGSGSGQGVGAGDGGGIGPGSGGGTGGGPYQPGAGIDPPTLVKEVRPSYTDAARRQSIEGDVVLEIVVRSDGSVGNVKVRRSLGGGLEQKAIDAVRQWRFMPAKRHGVPVDVVVDVSVEFKLR